MSAGCLTVDKDLINKDHLQYGGINRILLWHPKIHYSQGQISGICQSLGSVSTSKTVTQLHYYYFFPKKIADQAETIIPEIFFPGGTLEDP